VSGGRRTDEGPEEAEGVIRGWLRQADEFIRRSPTKGGGVTGKTGGTPADTKRPPKEKPYRP